MNAKYIAIIAIALSAISYYTYSQVHDSKTPTIDSLRVQAEEARLREEEATKARLEREDTLSQALYDSCYSHATSQTGSRFEEKQRQAYDCWKSETTNTNGTGKLAPSSEPPSRPITSNTQNHVTNQSTVRYDSQESSRGRDKIQQTPQADRKSVAIFVQNGSKVLIASSVSMTRDNGTKGKDSDYWVSYETAIKQIRKWEGLRLKSYWDFSHCSIGYGFSYPCGKSITQKQADTMLADLVKEKLQSVQKNFPNLSPEKQGTLVSFFHNCPRGYSDMVRRGLSVHQYWCKTAGGDRLQGLVNRRAEESKILFSKK